VESLAQWNKVERSGMKWEIGATMKSCWDNPGWQLTHAEGLPKGVVKRDYLGSVNAITWDLLTRLPGRVWL
jgi:hypothetical protein